VNHFHRFSIIGCGRIGRRPAEIIQQHGVFTAVCDIDEEKGRAVAAQFGAQFYKDISG